MLREIVAFGASGRFSSHSFDKWCLPVLERRGSFSLGFMAFNSRPSAFSYLSTECKQKASRDVIDGERYVPPMLTEFTVLGDFQIQLWEPKVGYTFFVQFPLLKSSIINFSQKPHEQFWKFPVLLSCNRDGQDFPHQSRR